MKISRNLSLREVIKSNTATRLGIDNTPEPIHLENLKDIAENIFQPVREYFGVPIGISSGYRSKALNRAVNGSPTSHHCKGMALDIDADIYGKVTNAEIFYYIKNNLEFTQLIWEYGTDKNPSWVHVGYNKNDLRSQVLIKKKGERYKPFE